MKRHSFFLALAAAAVVWGSGAGEARADSMPLSDLLGTTVNINNVNFTFDSYTSNVATADAVYVTFPVVGTDAPGFILTGPFGALAGANNDSDLVYTASLVNPAGAITGVSLNGDPASFGTGVTGVTETVYSGTSTAGPMLARIGVASAITPDAVIGNFAAQSTITIDSDLHSTGGSAGVSLTAVTQVLSGAFPAAGTVPEPSSMALLGIGMSSFLAFRRLIKWRTPV
jgi:PEP-CTERM motif